MNAIDQLQVKDLDVLISKVEDRIIEAYHNDNLDLASIREQVWINLTTKRRKLLSNSVDDKA